MKKFKVFLSCFLIMISVFLVSCKKNENPPNNSVIENENVSVYDVIGKAYKNLNDRVTMTTENNSNNFSNSSGRSFYEDYLQYGLEILDTISNLSYPTNVVYGGQTVSTLSALSANKVEKFYIDYSTLGNQVTAKIYVLCAKKQFESNPLNFALLQYDIDYNISNDKFSIQINIENSSSNDTYKENDTISNAKYFTFNYDNYRTNQIVAFKVGRATSIDFEDEQEINSATISSYESIFYDCFLNMKIAGSNKLTLGKEDKDYIRDVLSKFKDLENETFKLETPAQTTENLSELFIPVVQNFH